MNTSIKIIILTITVIAVAFYSGMKYDQSKNSASVTQGARNFANLSPEERQARLQQFGAASGNGGQRDIRSGGGFVFGEIISKDDPAPEQARYGAGKSVTIKLRDGGSKIIFLSDSTSVVKSVEGSMKDIVVGEQVSASGSPNSDGSVTAQSIQIRPSLPNNK